MKVHNPNNLPTIPIADLLPSQGDLKDLTETNYKKLKNVIEQRGFSVPVYVWEDDKGIKHLLDGHQRRQVLTTEGWTEPIPYLKIPAKDLQEAMARLLEITSQYATITQEGIDEFIGKYELNEAEVYESTSFDALGNYGDAEEVDVVRPNLDTSQSGVTGELNNSWKGDSVGYSALHKWVARHLGKPSKCEACGDTSERKYEWANLSRQYKRDLKDWKRMCTPCHRAYDNSMDIA